MNSSLCSSPGVAAAAVAAGCAPPVSAARGGEEQRRRGRDRGSENRPPDASWALLVDSLGGAVYAGRHRRSSEIFADTRSIGQVIIPLGVTRPGGIRVLPRIEVGGMLPWHGAQRAVFPAGRHPRRRGGADGIQDDPGLPGRGAARAVPVHPRVPAGSRPFRLRPGLRRVFRRPGLARRRAPVQWPAPGRQTGASSRSATSPPGPATPMRTGWEAPPVCPPAR